MSGVTRRCPGVLLSAIRSLTVVMFSSAVLKAVKSDIRNVAAALISLLLTVAHETDMDKRWLFIWKWRQGSSTVVNLALNVGMKPDKCASREAPERSFGSSCCTFEGCEGNGLIQGLHPASVCSCSFTLSLLQHILGVSPFHFSAS